MVGDCWRLWRESGGCSERSWECKDRRAIVCDSRNAGMMVEYMFMWLGQEVGEMKMI